MLSSLLRLTGGNQMFALAVCQPGWLAVFTAVNGKGFVTEPVACWFLCHADSLSPSVRPVCALGGEVCDATITSNYLGVVGPGTKPESLLDTKKNK